MLSKFRFLLAYHMELRDFPLWENQLNSDLLQSQSAERVTFYHYSSEEVAVHTATNPVGINILPTKNLQSIIWTGRLLVYWNWEIIGEWQTLVSGWRTSNDAFSPLLAASTALNHPRWYNNWTDSNRDKKSGTSVSNKSKLSKRWDSRFKGNKKSALDSCAFRRGRWRPFCIVFSETCPTGPT